METVFSMEIVQLPTHNVMRSFSEFLLPSPYISRISTGVSGLSEEALVTDCNAWSALRATKQLPHPPTPRSFYYSDYPCLMSAEAKKRLILGKAKQHQIRAQHVALATAQLRGEGRCCNPCMLCIL